jgi:hypothetical protein
VYTKPTPIGKEWFIMKKYSIMLGEVLIARVIGDENYHSPELIMIPSSAPCVEPARYLDIVDAFRGATMMVPEPCRQFVKCFEHKKGVADGEYIVEHCFIK